MPRLDGTGPAGKGPMTGCGLGNCIINVSKDGFIRDDTFINEEFKINDSLNQGFGRGFRGALRRRRGFGRCRGIY